MAQDRDQRIGPGPLPAELVADQHGMGTITERRFLATVCHYWVKVAEHRIEVKSQALQLSVGQKVNLFAPAHPLVIF